jgi:hypothetical protein
MTTTTIITAAFEELSVVGFAKAAALVLIVSIGFSPFPMNTPGLSPNTCVPVSVTRRRNYMVCLTALPEEKESIQLCILCMNDVKVVGN